jgi:hypothetical protein
MRTTLCFLIATLAACASSTAGSGSSSSPQTVLVPGGPDLRISGTDASNVHTIAYPVDQVWRALPATFDSIGVPVAAIDPAKRTMGNEGFKLRGRLKNTPLSRFIDCGNSTQVGANADNYDVNLTLLAEVQPGEQGTSKVVLTFQALAKPANFSQEYSQCSSRAVLETRFLDILKARLARTTRPASGAH